MDDVCNDVTVLYFGVDTPGEDDIHLDIKNKSLVILIETNKPEAESLLIEFFSQLGKRIRSLNLNWYCSQPKINSAFQMIQSCSSLQQLSLKGYYDTVISSSDPIWQQNELKKLSIRSCEYLDAPPNDSFNDSTGLLEYMFLNHPNIKYLQLIYYNFLQPYEPAIINIPGPSLDQLTTLYEYEYEPERMFKNRERFEIYIKLNTSSNVKFYKLIIEMDYQKLAKLYTRHVVNILLLLPVKI